MVIALTLLLSFFWLRMLFSQLACQKVVSALIEGNLRSLDKVHCSLSRLHALSNRTPRSRDSHDPISAWNLGVWYLVDGKCADPRWLRNKAIERAGVIFRMGAEFRSQYHWWNWDRGWIFSGILFFGILSSLPWPRLYYQLPDIQLLLGALIMLGTGVYDDLKYETAVRRFFPGHCGLCHRFSGYQFHFPATLNSRWGGMSHGSIIRSPLFGSSRSSML